MSNKVQIPGSNHPHEDTTHVKKVDHSELIELLLVLRHNTAPPDPILHIGNHGINKRAHFAPQKFLECHGASEEDLKAIRQYLHEYDLEIISKDKDHRTVQVRSTVAKINKAFKIELSHYRKRGHQFISHEGYVHIPLELEGIITGVFGLDERITAKRPRFSAGSGPKPPPVDDNTRSPAAFSDYYAFPEKATGKGECIGVLQFDGGFEPEKLNAYLQKLGVTPPEIIVREIGKGQNLPKNLPDSISPDVEVYLDLEIIASLAPNARIVAYFGENTQKGWIETVRAAIFDIKNRPSVISISWGMAEGSWTRSTLHEIDTLFQAAAHLGITICCASGDRGVLENDETDLYTVPFPASSPHVLACGGTHLEYLANGKIREIVWNQSEQVGMASGGGVSTVFALPAFQVLGKVPVHSETFNQGRGTPDVAANASSLSGYKIWADDTLMSMGGTSAAAPLWAGLIACLNEKLGKRIGYLTPLIYNENARQHEALRDIVIGNNIMPGGEGYHAGEGWDACTGLGCPNGEKLLQWLINTANKSIKPLSD